MDRDKPGDIIENRRQKLADLMNMKVELFPNDYKVSHTIYGFFYIFYTSRLPFSALPVV